MISLSHHDAKHASRCGHDAWPAAVGWSSMTGSDTMSMKNQLTGAQEVPPVTTGGTGTADTTFDKSTNVLTWTVTYPD